MTDPLRHFIKSPKRDTHSKNATNPLQPSGWSNVGNTFKAMSQATWQDLKPKPLTDPALIGLAAAPRISSGVRPLTGVAIKGIELASAIPAVRQQGARFGTRFLDMATVGGIKAGGGGLFNPTPEQAAQRQQGAARFGTRFLDMATVGRIKVPLPGIVGVREGARLLPLPGGLMNPLPPTRPVPLPGIVGVREGARLLPLPGGLITKGSSGRGYSTNTRPEDEIYK